MATINLGAIKFNWKGAYNSSTTYAVDDVVSSGGNSYVCIQAHSNQAVGNATAYWNIMSSAGTNGTDGTDVGATLANKEIAFKTNAGAVDGIPIGTAGQFLKVNSGATGYEYGAVSSDFVKLASATASGNPTSINFADIFTSTYSSYKIIVDNHFANSTSGSALKMKFLGTGTSAQSSGYYSINTNNYYNYSNAGNAGASTGHYDNQNHFHVTSENVDTNYSKPTVAEITLFNPRETGVYRWIQVMASIRASNSHHYIQSQSGYNNNTSDVFNGIQFIMNGSTTFGGGRFRVYGIK
nr:putative carbohydrate binding domain containing protein [uncultured Mediterranean phage uvMED]